MTLKNFFVVEGIDGCGKTTQIQMLREVLDEKQFFFTREPSDGRIGQFLREILSGKFASSSEALALLFAADRAEHLFGKGGMLEKIEAGKKILCDRYIFSTLAYQEDSETTNRLAALANSKFPLPEKVFFLKISPEDAIARIGFRGEEREIFESAEKLRRISENYEKIFSEFAKSAPEMKIVEIDATQSAKKICSKILSCL